MPDDTRLPLLPNALLRLDLLVGGGVAVRLVLACLAAHHRQSPQQIAGPSPSAGKSSAT
jgi:hypothetical protein